MEDIEYAKRARLATTPPSVIAMPEHYNELQAIGDERILDDRPMPDENVPVPSLLYEGFGHFLDIFRGHVASTGLDKAKLESDVDDFAAAMTELYDTEEDRRDVGLAALTTLFSRRFDSETRHEHGSYIGPHGAASFIVEFENEKAFVRTDLAVEVASHAAHPHVAGMKIHPKVFWSWRVPTLGLTVVGEPDVSLTVSAPDVPLLQ